MISSLEEAMRFFIKWREEKTPLDVIVSTDGLSVAATAFVSPRSDNDLLELYRDDSSGLLVRLQGLTSCSLEFLTPLEAGVLRTDVEALGLEHCWSIKSPEGFTLVLYERRA